MSYQQTSAAEDPMAIWYIVGAICLLFAIIIWRFLPEIVFASCLILHTLWGMIDWGPFHNFAAPVTTCWPSLLTTRQPSLSASGWMLCPGQWGSSG